MLFANREFCLDTSFKFHMFMCSVFAYFNTDMKEYIYSSAADIDKISHENLVKIIQSVENKTPVRNLTLKTLMKSITSAGLHIRILNKDTGDKVLD